MRSATFSPLRRVCAIPLLAVLLSAPLMAANDRDPWVGAFATNDQQGAGLQIDIKAADGGGYAGAIRRGDKSFAFTARADEGDTTRISGKFEASGASYDFTAAIAQGAMTLKTGNATYTLRPSGGGMAIAGAGPAAIAAPADAVVLRPQMFDDPFAGTDCMSVLVPQGWKLQGHVAWNPKSISVFAVSILAIDPRGEAGWASYPATFYTAGAGREGGEYGFGMRSEIRHVPASPMEYLKQYVVGKVRSDIGLAKDLKVLEETDLPKYAAARAAEAQGVQCQASKVVISYTSPQGQAVEERFICALISRPIGVGPKAVTMWHAEVTSARAPAGKLAGMLPLFDAIAASVAPQPKWYAFMREYTDALLQAQVQITNQMGADLADHMKRLHDQAREQSKEVSAAIREKFESEQKSKAATHQQFMNYVNNVAQFKSPGSTLPLTLPSGYRYNYISTGGQTISTNDPTYQPPADPKTSWTVLEPAK